MESLKAIFLHIPKTGGRSVNHALTQHFGTHKVCVMPRKEWMEQVEMGKNPGEIVSPGAAILSGHLYYPLIKPLHEPGVKIFTFLREPVSRVWSNYRFAMRRREELAAAGEPHEPLNESFEEYMQRDIARNKMARMLDGLPLKSIDYLGFTEMLSTGMLYVADLLGMPRPHVRVLNKGEASIPFTQLSKHTIRQVKELNAEDVKLYSQAKALEDYWIKKVLAQK